jgi:DNA-cytosine methyltransferase
MPTMKDLPKSERPREKLLAKGVDSLSKSELLSIILGSGIKGINVKTLAETIIDKFDKNLLHITIDDLLTIKGIGQAKALQIYSSIALVKRIDTKNKKSKLTFMDFCAGVGGGRLALDNLGMQCVGFSEVDKNAEKTYRVLFGDDEKNYGDLTKIHSDKLPDFDLMIAGFPCQAFSIIGQRKGIADKVQKKGEIIFHLIEFLTAKSVKYFIFENVKGLINHDKGQTLNIILEELNNAGYLVKWQVLNSLDYGVPQMRERIYFVGIQKEILGDNLFDFSFPSKKKNNLNLKDFLIDDRELEFNEKQQTYKTFQKYLSNKYNKNKFNIEKLLAEENLVIDTRQSDLRKYYNKVPTLRLGRHGILYTKNNKFRKLSGYESFLLQGFNKEKAVKARDNIADNHLLKQAGNAMTVSTVQSVANELLQFINKIQQNNMNNKQKLGSKTAKDGFKNEDSVISYFNNWKTSDYAQNWLKAMNYNLKEIEFVKAYKVKGSYKTDVQIEIEIEIKLKNLVDIQNLQVKLITNKDPNKKPTGKNQIDKRWVDAYQDMWNIPDNVIKILKHFTGELDPYIKNPRDERRMFIDELTSNDKNTLLDFLNKNKTLIVSDILKGRGKFAAEWMLVIVRNTNYEITHWALEPINIVMNYFSNGDIQISPKGSIYIGKILMQRKGGDNGRPTANMLQFNIDPAKLITKYE